MKIITKLVLALLVVGLIGALPMSAYASMPAQHVQYPSGVSTGTVTGKVISSVNSTVGIGGAYIAIVNSYNVSQEYANMTSDPNGNYTFTDVSVTGFPDQYKIYANKSLYSEGYSGSFSPDPNSTIMISVIIVSPIPAPSITPTPTPTVTLTPSPSPAPATTVIPSPTFAPSPTPLVINDTTATPLSTLATGIAPAPSPTSNALGTPIPTPGVPTPAISALMGILVIGVIAYFIWNKK